MAKKRVNISDPFAAAGGIQQDEADAILYGKPPIEIGKSALLDKIKRLDIFTIQPDPGQPRRVIPASVRKRFSAGEESLFFIWGEAVRSERGVDLDVERLLMEEEFPEANRPYDRSEKPGLMESSLLQVIDLAASIRRDGLTNPITVVKQGEHYLLETGERRWYAYHLLHSIEPDGEWQTIPARVVEEHDVWRQASENNARQNLNAIAKARQFGLLLMDLIRQEKGMVFQPITAFEHEQDFYAQVADAKEYRVPRGTNEQLLNAMGVTDRAMVSHYRRFLTLPHDDWMQADDENWTFEELLNVFNNSLESTKKAQSAVRSEYWSKAFQKDEKRLNGLLLKAKRSGEISQYVDYLRQLRRWIDAIESGLNE